MATSTRFFELVFTGGLFGPDKVGVLDRMGWRGATLHFCKVLMVAAGGKQKTGESVTVRKSFLALFELIASPAWGKTPSNTQMMIISYMQSHTAVQIDLIP